MTAVYAALLVLGFLTLCCAIGAVWGWLDATFEPDLDAELEPVDLPVGTDGLFRALVADGARSLDEEAA